jgi:hypothetical protein
MLLRMHWWSVGLVDGLWCFAMAVVNMLNVRLQPRPRCGTRIGDYAIDIGKLKAHITGGAISGSVSVFDAPTLNAFMALGKDAWSETRASLQKLFSAEDVSCLLFCS